MFRAKHPRRGILALLASPLLALIPRKAGADMPDPWTNYADEYSGGGGAPSSAPPEPSGEQPGTLVERIERIERWMAMHGGNVGAANSQYPHPYQSVNTLGFGNGIGLLSPNGIQLVGATAETPGLQWRATFLQDGQDPDTTYPHGVIEGYSTATNTRITPVARESATVYAYTEAYTASGIPVAGMTAVKDGNSVSLALTARATYTLTSLAGLLQTGPLNKTISGGVITADYGSYLVVDTEAAAGTDDLDTITNASASSGTLLICRAANAARSVVFKDGTGNLKLAGDFTADNAEDTIMLLYDGSNWLELSRSDNGA